MAEDLTGGIWVTTGGGISRYGDQKWVSYSIAKVNNVVKRDSRGNLWFGTDAGVSRYDGHKWDSFTRKNSGLVSDRVMSIIEDKYGNMWFGTWEGANRYSRPLWESLTVDNSGLVSDEANSVVMDTHGRLWVGTDRGVSRYDGESWRTYTETIGLPIEPVTSVFEDDQSNLWFGTAETWHDPKLIPGGTVKYDGANWKIFTSDNSSLGSGTINDIFEDKEHAIWFVANQGITRYDGTHWSTSTRQTQELGSKTFAPSL